MKVIVRKRGRSLLLLGRARRRWTIGGDVAGTAGHVDYPIGVSAQEQALHHPITKLCMWPQTAVRFHTFNERCSAARPRRQSLLRRCKDLRLAVDRLASNACGRPRRPRWLLEQARPTPCPARQWIVGSRSPSSPSPSRKTCGRYRLSPTGCSDSTMDKTRQFFCGIGVAIAGDGGWLH